MKSAHNTFRFYFSSVSMLFQCTLYNLLCVIVVFFLLCFTDSFPILHTDSRLRQSLTLNLYVMEKMHNPQIKELFYIFEKHLKYSSTFSVPLPHCPSIDNLSETLLLECFFITELKSVWALQLQNIVDEFTKIYRMEETYGTKRLSWSKSPWCVCLSQAE